jgi:hypothetical protein
VKAGEKFWVRDNEGTWCICDYWDRTKDGDRFCVVTDIDRVIILPPDFAVDQMPQYSGSRGSGTH